MSRLSRKLFTGAAAMALALFAAQSGNAADYYMNVSQGGGRSWNNQEDWQPAAAGVTHPAVGNNYWVGRKADGTNTTGYGADSNIGNHSYTHIRTPTTDPAVYPTGATLTVDTSGTIYAKAWTVTIPDLVLKGNGALVQAQGPGGGAINWNGKITVPAGATPIFSCQGSRGHIANAVIEGSGDIKVINCRTDGSAVMDSSNNYLRLNADNPFAGTYDLTIARLEIAHANALKAATKVTITSGSLFQTNSGINPSAPNMTLDIKANGKVKLDSNVTVKKLIVNGTEIGGTPGMTYTAADLAKHYPTQFSGTGNIIIQNPVPVEMSTFQVE